MNTNNLRQKAIEDRIEQELYEAQEVKKIKIRFLDDFFDRKEKELWDAFGRTKIGDSTSLIEIHHQFKSLNALRAEVQTAVNTGKLAQAEKDATRPA
ncbi:hypothetical protein DRQ25_10790 [Candidatus Fermentibacteria bacterium]|nr:MAG: hypothetical protein DRQ25_10790 [Candidatus Fermentibacteria bacterium]